MSKVLIVVPNGHIPKYLQACIYTLKKYKNDVETDILIMNTWPGHPSLKAITGTDLGDGVFIEDCTIRMHSHATALDEAIDWAEDKDYDYLLCVETDAVACQDGWVDWFLSFFTDDGVGMAGFFWSEGNNHFNINPSVTLYSKKMLLQYHKEVRANDENIFWHPVGNRHGNDAGMDPTIKDVAGAFSETRGIKDPTAEQEKYILAGVPQAAWFEPGAWLYCRSIGEWGGVHVPCDHIYTQYGNHTAPQGTYYGGQGEPYAIHRWGGTRCYDGIKHIVNDNFVSQCAPLWMEREHRIWKEIVPVKYREIIPSVYDEMEFEQKMKDNLPTWEEVARLLGSNWMHGGDI